MHDHCLDYARTHAAAGAGLPAIEPGMPTPAGTGLSRRSMLLRSMGLGLSVYGAGALRGTASVEAAISEALNEHKVLVSVFVEGGWDSLSVLPPLGTDSRHEARMRALRPSLTAAIARDQSPALSADPSLAWHPAMQGIRALWDDPGVGVAIAPAVGNGTPNYSHFTSRHFWEVGAVEVGGSTGWMGRYLDRVGSANVPIQGITIGSSLSPTLATAKVPVATVADIDNYKYGYAGAGGTISVDAAAELLSAGSRASGDAQRDQARMATSAGFQMVDSMKTSALTGDSPVSYPATSSYFVDSLKDAARLLGTRISGSALPIRCIALRGHGSYDTHGSQEPSFSSNLKVTSDAVGAFWSDLRARGEDDRVVMLVWSEFGRRPQENGSAGCDHGAAGTAFVIGKSVKQGLIGEFPGLKTYGSVDSGLMQDGNLRATSDFRGLYAALLEQWMETDADGIIPGAGLKPGSGAFARPVLF